MGSDSEDVGAVKRVVAQSKVTVSRSVKKSGQAESVTDLPDEVEVHSFVTTPAVVHLTVPIKLAKDYNSAGITVGVSIPCYKEEIEDAQAEATRVVHKMLSKQVPEIVKMLGRLKELSNGA